MSKFNIYGESVFTMREIIAIVLIFIGIILLNLYGVSLYVTDKVPVWCLIMNTFSTVGSLYMIYSLKDKLPKPNNKEVGEGV